MGSEVIRVENLYKQYRLGTISTGSLSHDLNRWWHQIRGKEDPYLKIGEVNDRTVKSDTGYVWALKDLNLSVNEGDILGIIGKNGAGKSTLLKILSKVTSPTLGRVMMKGKISSLLEVGTGFHQEMTGRENIYLNGTIMGLKRREINSRINEIIEFAGIEKYIDTPVKRYSSGMTVRLGFAVAAHLEPDILVVDEVLAVGDAEFQKRAIGKMKDVSSSQGRTVLFVSHNMASMKTLCNRGVLIESGQVGFEGSIDDTIVTYLNKNISDEGTAIIKSERINEIAEGVIKNEHPRMRIEEVSISDERKQLKHEFFSTESILITTKIRAEGRLNDLRVMVHIVDATNKAIITSQVSDNLEFIEYIENEKIEDNTYEFSCLIPSNLLSEHRYYLSIEAINPKVEHIVLNKALFFDVRFQGYNGIQYASKASSLLRPLFKWDFQKL